MNLIAYGHAETAPAGQDTVCAAVSALIYGFAAEIGNHLNGERFYKRAVEVGGEKGGADIEAVCTDERTYRRVLYNLAPVERGLEVLAQKYPEAVSLKIRS